jgi:hypothetical protein
MPAVPSAELGAEPHQNAVAASGVIRVVIQSAVIRFALGKIRHAPGLRAAAAIIAQNEP